MKEDHLHLTRGVAPWFAADVVCKGTKSATRLAENGHRCLRKESVDDEGRLN